MAKVIACLLIAATFCISVEGASELDSMRAISWVGINQKFEISTKILQLELETLVKAETNEQKKCVVMNSTKCLKDYNENFDSLLKQVKLDAKKNPSSVTKLSREELEAGARVSILGGISTFVDKCTKSINDCVSKGKL